MEPERGEPPEPSQVVWDVEEPDDDLQTQARGAVSRGGKPARRRAPKVNLDDIEIPGKLTKKERQKVDTALSDAGSAFAAGRFRDARRELGPLLERWPDVVEVRELAGLTAYRLEHYRKAIEHLEAFARMTGSADQHPPLADSHRAQRHWKRVDELWDELREQSPSAELVTEGRIVTAGSLADRGNLTEGIKLLERGWSLPGRPKEHHLRRAYALADLYERAGELPQARNLFASINRADPDFADVTKRLRSLA